MASAVSKDDLLTGEAVVVALPYAGLPIRALSGMLDALAQIVLAVALSALLSHLGAGLDEALITAFGLLIFVFCFVAFPSICEVITGRTFGKALTSLRTVRSDGAPADPRRVITRHLIGVVEIWLTGGVVAMITGLFTEPTRRLGDLAAGTYVARTRVHLRLPRPATMPPALEGWARTADLGRLPDDLVAVIRSNLAQSGDFTAGSARRVDEMLAARALTYVSPPPPPGTPPNVFLCAVMAERRRRETARLESAEARRQRLFGAPVGH